MSPPFLAVLTALLLLFHAGSATAAGTTKSASAQLICGKAILTLRTTFDPHAPPDDGFAWINQVLKFEPAPGTPEKLLFVDPAPEVAGTGGAKTLSDVVMSWQCVHGSQHKYFLLDVTCERGDLGGVCAGQQEWFRILDTNANRPDEGYSPQDPRYDKLYERLGITVNGVQLIDATGS
jgi:hypothetical protein